METQHWLKEGNLGRLLENHVGNDKGKGRLRVTEKALLPWDSLEAPNEHDKHWKIYKKELEFKESRQDERMRWKSMRAAQEKATEQDESLFYPRRPESNLMKEDPVCFLCHHEEGAWDWLEELPFPPPPASEWRLHREKIAPMQVVWMLNQYKKRLDDHNTKQSELDLLKEKLVAYVELLLRSVNGFHEQLRERQGRWGDFDNNDFEADYNDPNSRFKAPDIPVPEGPPLGSHPNTTQEKIWTFLIERLINLDLGGVELVSRVFDAAKTLDVLPHMSAWVSFIYMCREYKACDIAIKYHQLVQKNPTLLRTGGGGAWKLPRTVLDTCLAAGETHKAMCIFFEMKAKGYLWDATACSQILGLIGDPKAPLDVISENYKYLCDAASDRDMRFSKKVLFTLLTRLYEHGIAIRKDASKPPQRQHGGGIALPHDALPAVHPYGRQPDATSEGESGEGGEDSESTERSNAYLEKAVYVFQTFCRKRSAPPSTYGMALQAYAHLGDTRRARECYDHLVTHRLLRTSHHVDAMLSILAKDFDAEGAWQLWQHEQLSLAQLGRAVEVMLRCARFDRAEQALAQYELRAIDNKYHWANTEPIYRRIIEACNLLDDTATATHFTKRMEWQRRQRGLSATSTSTSSPSATRDNQHQRRPYNNNNNNNGNNKYNSNRSSERREGRPLRPFVRNHPSTPLPSSQTSLSPDGDETLSTLRNYLG